MDLMAPHKNIKILLVEDNEIDVMAIQRRFNKANILNEITVAESGIDALKLLRGETPYRKIDGPYIMLTDINMPLMNGLELLEEVRKDEDLKGSTVFVLTTSSRDKDLSAAYNLNIAGYFLKENLDQLINMLSIYWDINQFPQDTVCLQNPSVQ